MRTLFYTLTIALVVCFSCNIKDNKGVYNRSDFPQMEDQKEDSDMVSCTASSCVIQLKQVSLPIDTLVTKHSDGNVLYTYIYERYDTLVNQPVKSFAVKDAKDSVLLLNNGDSLFLEDYGPNKEHVTIYPIFIIRNKENLEITLMFGFYPEISCAYTINIVNRLNLHRPYSDGFKPFIKYTITYTNKKFEVLRSLLFEPNIINPTSTDTLYKKFILLKSRDFLPVEKKDQLFLDLYYAVLLGDTTNAYEIIYNYNNKFDPSDIEYQLTRYLTSYCIFHR